MLSVEASGHSTGPRQGDRPTYRSCPAAERLRPKKAAAKRRRPRRRLRRPRQRRRPKGGGQKTAAKEDGRKGACRLRQQQRRHRTAPSPTAGSRLQPAVDEDRFGHQRHPRSGAHPVRGPHVRGQVNLRWCHFRGWSKANVCLVDDGPAHRHLDTLGESGALVSHRLTAVSSRRNWG